MDQLLNHESRVDRPRMSVMQRDQPEARAKTHDNAIHDDHYIVCFKNEDL